MRFFAFDQRQTLDFKIRLTTEPARRWEIQTLLSCRYYSILSSHSLHVDMVQHLTLQSMIPEVSITQDFLHARSAHRMQCQKQDHPPPNMFARSKHQLKDPSHACRTAIFHRSRFYACESNNVLSNHSTTNGCFHPKSPASNPSLASNIENVIQEKKNQSINHAPFPRLSCAVLKMQQKLPKMSTQENANVPWYINSKTNATLMLVSR